MKTVLLVDDEPMIREVLIEKLRPLVDSCLEANNGQEALQLLSANPNISVVVTDIKMPVMGGVELIKCAREQGHKQAFIFFTAYASREMLNEVVQHGVHDFIDKGMMDGLEEAVLSGFIPPFRENFDLVKEIARLEKG